MHSYLQIGTNKHQEKSVQNPQNIFENNADLE
jgi:hypothetical protein